MLIVPKLIFNKYIQMQSIIKKELVCLVRERRLLLLLAIIILLLATALFSGYNHFAAVSKERNELNEAMRKDWETQEEKHAHSAAHYGTFIFTPQPLLSFFDFGVKNYTGSSIRVEAHLQQDAQFTAANESSGSIRFGDMNLAMVLQVLLPLLLIFLCFNAVSGEKEKATLKLMALQGAGNRTILWQKVMAYCIVAVAILAPVLVVSGIVAAASGNEVFTADIMLRLIGMFLLYAAFYFIVIAATITVSAVTGNSKNALLTMLAIWLLLLVLLPKYTTNLGDNLFPLPSKQEFKTAVANDVKKGVDGHNPSDERSKQFIDSILAAYKVDTISKLKINIDGLLMQADEDYRAMVTKKYFGKLYEQIEKQNNVSQYASFINPFLAVKDISMALASTNYYHQVLFEQAVQDYRLYMMRYLNEYMSYNNKSGEWETAAPREVLNALKKFNYHPPPVTKSLQSMLLAITAIAVWMVLSFWMVNKAAQQLKLI